MSSSLTTLAKGQLVINDLGYFISENDEVRLNNFFEELKSSRVIEVFSPRIYHGDFRPQAAFSDFVIYLNVRETIEIEIIQNELLKLEESVELDSLVSMAFEKYFSRNLLFEGLRYTIHELARVTNKCSLTVLPEETPFTPDIDGDWLEIQFETPCAEYNIVKLSICNSMGLSADVKGMNIKQTRTGVIAWNGRINDETITSQAGPYSIVFQLLKDSSSNDPLTTSFNLAIDPAVDEWNKHKKQFDGYVVKDQFEGTNFQFYRDRLKEALITNIPEAELSKYDNPLDYLADNIERTTFLGASFLTHKKLAVKLAQVEAQLESNGTFGEIKQSYQHLINGSFALRRIKDRTYISPHSIAAAIDIDPPRNPHIKDEWGEQIFRVIYYVTSVQLYDAKPSVSSMKAANNDFKEHFDLNYVNSIENLKNIESKNLASLDSSLKFQGHFDLIAKYLYEELSEATLKYFAVDAAVTDEEKNAKSQRLDVINGLKKQVDLLNNTVLDYIRNHPLDALSDSSFIPLHIDKEILLRKLNILLTFSSGSIDAYSQLNLQHSMNAEKKSQIDWSKVSNAQAVLPDLQAQRAALLKMAEVGFFEMDTRIVNAFIDLLNIRWGGNFNKEKDFMHFELYPLTKSLR